MTAHRWVMEAPDQPLVRTDFEPETPGRGEVLIEVAGCGVCHTDLGFYYGGVRTRHPLPLTLGHEISGTVIAAGPGAETLLGNNVIIPAVIPCGECDLCQRDLGTICRRQKSPGIDMHGGFATHVTVPAYGLCEIDMERLKAAGLTLPDVSVVADAVTTPYQAIMQAGVSEGDLVIVIGVGGVGGYAVQIANALGASVVAIDIDDAKLEALGDFGATAVFNAREIGGRELRDAIRDFAKSNGLRQTEWKIFECSGTAAGQSNAFGLLTFGASLSVVGFTMEKIEVRLANLMAFHARALGNWGCLPRYYPRALDMVLDKKVQMLPFIEQHPLASINDVFRQSHAGKLRKRAILVPPG